MIRAAIFKTTDPAERTRLIVSGSPEHVGLNVPSGGCWREVPPDAASAEDVPALGALTPPVQSGAASTRNAP